MQGVVHAWREMPRWPLFAWLNPQLSVRLFSPEGRDTFWLSDGRALRPLAGTGGKTRLVAVQLPEERLLRRKLSLPAMADSDRHEALRLDAQSASPFPLDDMTWGYRISPGGSGQSSAETVIASRKQIARFIESLGTKLGGVDSPQVWALSDGQAPIPLRGFGEETFERQFKYRRYAAHGLLLLALGLLAAMAVTPTAQLRLRAIEAVNAYTDLRQQAEPALSKRATLQGLNDKAATLKELTAGHVDPLWVVEKITEVLPDDTSLISLTVQGQKTSLYGVTANAATLMQQLSSQPGLRDVKAPQAAMRPSGATKDTFTIELKLVAPPPPAVPSVGRSGVPAEAVAPASAQIQAAPASQPTVKAGNP